MVNVYTSADRRIPIFPSTSPKMTTLSLRSDAATSRILEKIAAGNQPGHMRTLRGQMFFRNAGFLDAFAAQLSARNLISSSPISRRCFAPLRGFVVSSRGAISGNRSFRLLQRLQLRHRLLLDLPSAILGGQLQNDLGHPRFPFRQQLLSMRQILRRFLLPRTASSASTFAFRLATLSPALPPRPVPLAPRAAAHSHRPSAPTAPNPSHPDHESAPQSTSRRRLQFGWSPYS